VAIAILALRGAAAIAVLTTLVGGIPRLVQAALAATIGLWSAIVVAPEHAVDATVAHAVEELAIGAALGVAASLPLMALAAAGRLVDLAATGRAQGPYAALFGLVAAAVFVGVNGHVAVIAAVVASHHTISTFAGVRPGVLEAIYGLVPVAIRLAVPWLVTAAVVQLAVGAGQRVAARAAPHVPAGAAVPAALVMMTAALLSVLAVAAARMFAS
jgi:flagellar biosynthesis protein FliR